ncbi:MAG: cupin domain-containing protein [Halobacteria archaeon]|nr:cupin domain-containing protein [Halobacteria archaeon]
MELEPYEVIENPAVRQEFRFLERGTGEDGDYFVCEIRYGTDTKHFPEHVHPRQEKTFKVLEGELTVVMGGDERILQAGEEITIPEGTPHYIRTSTDSETRVLYHARPALAQDAIFRTMAALAQDGKTNDEGIPGMLQLAVIMDGYSGNVYLTSPPVVVQKALFKILAPIGRLLGYKADYSAESSDSTLLSRI